MFALVLLVVAPKVGLSAPIPSLGPVDISGEVSPKTAFTFK